MGASVLTVYSVGKGRNAKRANLGWNCCIPPAGGKQVVEYSILYQRKARVIVIIAGIVRVYCDRAASMIIIKRRRGTDPLDLLLAVLHCPMQPPLLAAQQTACSEAGHVGGALRWGCTIIQETRQKTIYKSIYMFLSGIVHTAFFRPDVASIFCLAVCVKVAEVEWREREKQRQDDICA